MGIPISLDYQPKRFYPLRKGCRESLHPSLVIPDTGSHETLVPYLTSEFPRVADITGGEGRVPV